MVFLKPGESELEVWVNGALSDSNYCCTKLYKRVDQLSWLLGCYLNQVAVWVSHELLSNVTFVFLLSSANKYFFSRKQSILDESTGSLILNIPHIRRYIFFCSDYRLWGQIDRQRVSHRNFLNDAKARKPDFFRFTFTCMQFNCRGNCSFCVAFFPGCFPLFGELSLCRWGAWLVVVL